jgi:RNA polymerase sigma factor (sigma-70 family)
MTTTNYHSESSLVRELQLRKNESFNFLIKNYSYALRNVISNYLKNELDQEDIMQEVWLKIYRGIHKYNHEKAGLYCWMVAITRNLCIDFIRKEKKYYSESLEDTPLSNSPSFAVEQHEDYIGVNDLVDNVKESDASVARLYFFQGYSHKEISEELNIPIGTSKSRLRSSLKNIRKYTGISEGLSKRA